MHFLIRRKVTDIDATDVEFNLAAPVVRTLDTMLSGHLSVSGNQAPFDLKATCASSALATRNVDLRREIVDAFRRSNAAGVNTTNATPLFNFDVSAQGSGTIGLDSSSYHVSASSQLRLIGTSVRPLVTGHVELDEGRFFYKRQFQITRGNIGFTDASRNDPTLDIVATTTVSPYRVTILVGGTASHPTVDLNVDPPTREDGHRLQALMPVVL